MCPSADCKNRVQGIRVGTKTSGQKDAGLDTNCSGGFRGYQNRSLRLRRNTRCQGGSVTSKTGPGTGVGLRLREVSIRRGPCFMLHIEWREVIHYIRTGGIHGPFSRPEDEFP
jgi:hypothetical protein